MVEALGAYKATSWLTAMAVENLSRYFSESVEHGIGKWSKELQNIISSREMRAIEGMQERFNEGMYALSESINAVNQETKEGTAAVLRALMELKETQQYNEQRNLFKRAVDAIEDVTSGMYAVGNSRNIDLVETASVNARRAAQYHNGDFILKIKAYRLYLATEYMHQATLHSCSEAKKTALTILGRKILMDDDITSICDKYSRPRGSKDSSPELTQTGRPSQEAGWISWSGSPPLPSDVSEAMEFLLDVISSTAMLEPLDKAVSGQDIITAEENGVLKIGPSAPRNVIFALGRFCASNPQVAVAYPAVRAVALPEWEAGKERLAMDNFFVSMGGEDWEHNGKWMDGDADLSERFGLTLENGHITKISLAANNLEGVLHDDLADLKHLRELVLHGNNIYGDVPPRLQSLIMSKPHMVVKGLPAPGMKTRPTEYLILRMVSEIHDIAEGVEDNDRQARRLAKREKAIEPPALAVTEGTKLSSPESLRQLLATVKEIRNFLSGYARTTKFNRALKRRGYAANFKQLGAILTEGMQALQLDVAVDLWANEDESDRLAELENMMDMLERIERNRSENHTDLVDTQKEIIGVLKALQSDERAELKGWVEVDYGIDLDFEDSISLGGGSLWDFLHSSSEPLTHALQAALLLDIARGMSFLHIKGIVHRDLESANVLVFNNLRLKLCDFGLSKGKTETSSRSKLGPAGTAQWTSPEEMDEGPANELTDVYSYYGVVCFEVATRMEPFKGLTQIQVTRAVSDKEKRPLIPEWASASPDVVGLMERCWKQDPTERPKGFSPVVRALRPKPILEPLLLEAIPLSPVEVGLGVGSTETFDSALRRRRRSLMQAGYMHAPFADLTIAGKDLAPSSGASVYRAVDAIPQQQHGAMPSSRAGGIQYTEKASQQPGVKPSSGAYRNPFLEASLKPGAAWASAMEALPEHHGATPSSRSGGTHITEEAFSQQPHAMPSSSEALCSPFAEAMSEQLEASAGRSSIAQEWLSEQVEESTRRSSVFQEWWSEQLEASAGRSSVAQEALSKQLKESARRSSVAQEALSEQLQVSARGSSVAQEALSKQLEESARRSSAAQEALSAQLQATLVLENQDKSGWSTGGKGNAKVSSRQYVTNI
eukprot:g13194.t1